MEGEGPERAAAGLQTVTPGGWPGTASAGGLTGQGPQAGQHLGASELQVPSHVRLLSDWGNRGLGGENDLTHGLRPGWTGSPTPQVLGRSAAAWESSPVLTRHPRLQ